jgi:hypothetical protein
MVRCSAVLSHEKILYLRAKERFGNCKHISQVTTANYNDHVAGDIPDDLPEAVQLYGTMAHPEWNGSLPKCTQNASLHRDSIIRKECLSHEKILYMSKDQGEI